MIDDKIRWKSLLLIYLLNKAFRDHLKSKKKKIWKKEAYQIIYPAYMNGIIKHYIYLYFI